MKRNAQNNQSNPTTPKTEKAFEKMLLTATPQEVLTMQKAYKKESDFYERELQKQYGRIEILKSVISLKATKGEKDEKAEKELNTRKRQRAKTAKEFEKAKAYLNICESVINEKGIITADNVQTIGERIAVKALKTCYQKGGQPFIYSLYRGLCADIAEKGNRQGEALSDGYDIAQTATALLCEYMGKSLADIADGNGKGLDKEGNPITIKRAVFRAVNRYIMGERQKQYKCVYVDDINEDGETLYYEVPEKWDISTATDFLAVMQIIKALDLPPRQMQVLRYRLQGVATDSNTARKADSLHTIAHKMGITRQAVQNLLRKIQAKAVEIGLSPTSENE